MTSVCDVNSSSSASVTSTFRLYFKVGLNNLISTRCDAAHQAVTTNNPSCAPHLVKRDDLEKAIRFLKGLVNVTEQIEMIK